MESQWPTFNLLNFFHRLTFWIGLESKCSNKWWKCLCRNIFRISHTQISDVYEWIVIMLLYNAHVNVEIGKSLRAIKNIYNYIVKVFDCVNVEEEIRWLTLLSRYVSTIWRLRKYLMHDSAIRHSVRVSNQQIFTLQKGNEWEAQLRAQLNCNHSSKSIKLLWMTGNIPIAMQYGNWQVRKRGGGNVLSKI